jgi:hypothetical protein
MPALLARQSLVQRAVVAASAIPFRFTAWDGKVALRAAAIAILAFGVAWIVTASTDEGGLTWGVRLGRSLPVAPACAAVGAAIALAPARARGEIRALASLGRSPFESALAAVVGGAVVALAAAALMAAVPSVDVEGFFPATRHGVEFRFDEGGFVDTVHGWRIESDGALSRVPALDAATVALAAVPRHGRAAAAVVTALAGVALAFVAAHALVARPATSGPGEGGRAPERGSVARALSFVFACAVASVVAFHAAAAGRIGVEIATIPALVMLAGALLRYRPTRWPTNRA